MATKPVQVRNLDGDFISPSTEDSMILLLGRLIKMLESNATVDSSNRQRIVVETMPSVSVSSGSVGVQNLITNPPAGNPLASQTNTVANMVLEGPVDQRWRIIDAARTAFATGIRANLT